MSESNECTGLKDCECERCTYEREAHEKDEHLLQLVQRSNVSLADLYKKAKAKGLVIKRSDYS